MYLVKNSLLIAGNIRIYSVNKRDNRNNNQIQLKYYSNTDKKIYSEYMHDVMSIDDIYSSLVDTLEHMAEIGTIKSHDENSTIGLYEGCIVWKNINNEIIVRNRASTSALLYESTRTRDVSFDIVSELIKNYYVEKYRNNLVINNIHENSTTSENTEEQ